MLKLKFYRGFSLLELMIVITIIAVLSTTAIPSYQNYVKRARFIELINIASVYKTAIILALQEGYPINELNVGVYGIPDAPKKTKNLDHLSIENGTITLYATESLKNLTYILQPNEDGSVWTTSGTCINAGICHA